MSNQFTPGPWGQIIAQPGTMLEIVNNNSEYVCSLIGGDEHKQENARLIAAAPDLLHALQMCARFIEDGEDDSHTFFTCREAWRNAFAKVAGS